MDNFKYNIYWHFKLKRSNSRALKALEIIEGYKGKINPKFRKLSDEYAKEVLGNKAYAPWLYVYSAMQNDFKEGWIPDNFYAKEVVPKLNGDYGKTVDRNFITPFLFSKVETLDIGYFINGKFFTPESKIIDSKNIQDHLFKKQDKIVYKLENSKRGKGVFIIDRNNFDASTHLFKTYSNGVFQKFIQQHPFFSEFTDSSVATLRVTTVSDKLGNISAKAAYIRFGRDKDTHIIYKTVIAVPVDIKTGELHSKGYINDWVEIDTHPDSHISFQQKTIPNFNKCIDKAIQLHSVIPFMGCLGWDLTVDNLEEVQLIEVNAINNGIKLSESNSGPCFTDLNWENLWKKI
jgi:hypothetical protein